MWSNPSRNDYEASQIAWDDDLSSDDDDYDSLSSSEDDGSSFSDEDESDGSSSFSDYNNEDKEAYDEDGWNDGVMTESRGITSHERANGFARNEFLWPPEKKLLKVRFLNGGAWEKDTVEYLVKKHYHQVPMHIRFEFLRRGAPGPSDIRISFGSSSESHIGREAEHHHGEATMWLDMHPKIKNTEQRRLHRQGTVLHEFGHALGMVHEHQHPDCKARWNYRVLEARTGWGAQAVKRNYGKVDSTRASLAPYDRRSIMHYPIQRGDTVDGKTNVPRNNVLSEGDKQFLIALYPLPQIKKPKMERKPKRESKSAKMPIRQPDTRPEIKTNRRLEPTWDNEVDCCDRNVVPYGGNSWVKGGYAVMASGGFAFLQGGGYVGFASVVVNGQIR